MQPEPHAEPNRKLTPLPPQCTSVQARLFDYLDGDLPLAEIEVIRAHLDACAVCGREEALSRHSEQALTSALSAVPPAGDLRAGFYARLAASNQAASAWPRWAGWCVAVPSLAAVLLAAFFVRGVLSPSRSLSPTRPELPNIPQTVRQPSADAFNAERNTGERIKGNSLPKNPQPSTKFADERFAIAPALAEPALPRLRALRHPLHQSRYRRDLFALRSAHPLSAVPKFQTASAARDNYMYWGGRNAGRDLYERLDSSSLEPPAEATDELASDAVSRDSQEILSAKVAPALRQRVLSQTSVETTSASDVISLHVVDEERGFTATTHLTNVSDEQDDGERITIETDSIPDAGVAVGRLARKHSIKSQRGAGEKHNLHP
jgi:hypothetical protein